MRPTSFAKTNHHTCPRSANKSVVKFNERLRFEFDENASIAPLSKQVTVVNTPLLVRYD